MFVSFPCSDLSWAIFPSFSSISKKAFKFQMPKQIFICALFICCKFLYYSTKKEQMIQHVTDIFSLNNCYKKVVFHFPITYISRACSEMLSEDGRDNFMAQSVIIVYLTKWKDVL